LKPKTKEEKNTILITKNIYIMEVEIKIKIRPENHNDFSERELIYDLKMGFPEFTGYQIHDIQIKSK
jgi:hypothetical protein